MIPKNNNFTLTIQNPCVEYLQYLEKANCGFFLNRWTLLFKITNMED